MVRTKAILVAAFAVMLSVILGSPAMAGTARPSVTYRANGQIRAVAGGGKWCLTAAAVKPSAVVLIERCAPKDKFAPQEWSSQWVLGSLTICMTANPNICLEAGGSDLNGQIQATLYHTNDKKLNPNAFMVGENARGGITIGSQKYRKLLASNTNTIQGPSMKAVFRVLPKGKTVPYIWVFSWEAIQEE